MKSALKWLLPALILAEGVLVRPARPGRRRPRSGQDRSSPPRDGRGRSRPRGPPLPARAGRRSRPLGGARRRPGLAAPPEGGEDRRPGAPPLGLPAALDLPQNRNLRPRVRLPQTLPDGPDPGDAGVHDPGRAAGRRAAGALGVAAPPAPGPGGLRVALDVRPLRLPHHLEEGGLRLRHGAVAEGFVPFSEMAAVERTQRRAPGPGDGLQTDPEEDEIYLSTGGRTDLTLRLRSPHAVQGLFRSAGPSPTIHLAADEPEKLASKLRERIGEVSPSKPQVLA